MKFAIPAIAASLLAVLPIAAAGAQHVHGAGNLTVALDDLGGLVELEIPADDVVGFETEATTDAQTAQIADAIAALSNNDILTFNDQAGCTVTSQGAEHEVTDDHAEFHVEMEIACTDTAAISGMTTTLFTLFPDLAEVEVELFQGQNASSYEWEADSATLAL